MPYAVIQRILSRQSAEDDLHEDRNSFAHAMREFHDLGFKIQGAVNKMSSHHEQLEKCLEGTCDAECTPESEKIEVELAERRQRGERPTGVSQDRRKHRA